MYQCKTILLNFTYLILFYVNLSYASDKFNEELFIKPLPTGHVNTYFQFTTEWLIKNNESRKLIKSIVYYDFYIN